MRYILLFIIALLWTPVGLNAQCTTTNATGCSCKTLGSTNCDLLPDIKAAEAPMLVLGSSGVIEYSQTGNGADNGRLRISVSTPNIGHGPLEIRATTTFVCGTDTFFGTAPTICADGSNPKIIINQRIYHKNGNTMSYYDHPAGTMTYHPSHGHMHIDDWGVFTLRKEDTTQANPLLWPIVGSGSKLAFCLMDYGTCSYYSGHCRDDNNNNLLNADFPNWGLGGGNYNCSPVFQGISSGYTDIYYQYLDGMWINIPPGTCNGDYYIVAEIDPNNNFLEENDSNNIQVVPFTLTQQSTAAFANISYSGGIVLCNGQAITLSANVGNTYSWSNGATTQIISVTTPGTYNVTVDSDCGVGVSAPVTITGLNASSPTTANVTIPNPASATLSANGSATGEIRWYDSMTGGNELGTGAVWNTPIVNNTTTFYAADVESIPGTISYSPPHDNAIGTGANHTSSQRYLTFDVHQNMTLKSVKVYSTVSSSRTIELRDASGNILQSATVSVPVGEHRITLNFNISPGSDYQLGTSIATVPDFFRNDNGVNYPYSVSGLVDITGSSSGAAYYYFYYDWEVKEQDFECASTRVPATVVVLNPTGINDIDYSKSVSVYPNPSSGIVNISIESVKINSLNIKLFDITGKEVLDLVNKSNVNGNYNQMFDFNYLSKGLYAIRLTVNGKNVTKKISIE